MRIALIQQHLAADRDASLQRGLTHLGQAARGGAELAAFAELAFEPFYPRCRRGETPRTAETIPGPTTDALCRAAKEHSIVVVGNLYEQAGERYYDASPVIDADGTLLGVQRMLHITDYEGFFEQDYYDEGDRGAPVFATRACKLGVVICYDRHYPEVMRRMGLGGAELVVVPQAGTVGEWPEGLYEAELRVAAFQNGYFTALCNRVGTEGELQFAGESFVCDPEGQVSARAPRGEDCVLLDDLDLTSIARSTAKRLFLQHRRTDW
ncbi:MAG: carbon-nitrogen hydrolase family protein [Planctomycetota bacterium]